MAWSLITGKYNCCCCCCSSDCVFCESCLQEEFFFDSWGYYGGPKVSLTAISICPRQFQFAHGSSNFAHGNFNLLTAVSICSRQFQLRSRQFQFAHGSFNLLTAVLISLTAVSISLMMNLQWISANIGHAGCQVLWEIMKCVAKLLITFVT